jgi:hypothetical protein
LKYLILVLSLFFAGELLAQPVKGVEKKPRIPGIEDPKVDSNYYTIPPADSARMYDSIYRLRAEEVRKREKKELEREWNSETIKINIGANGYGKFRAPDLNEYFAEVTGRENPSDDRANLSTIDRIIYLGGIAQLSRDYAIYAEYSYLARWYNTLVENSQNTEVANGEHTLDYTAHTFVAGPQVTLYQSNFFRLRAYGGIGGAVIFITEREDLSKSERTGNGTGFAVNFGIPLDFRIMDWLTFNFDFYGRSIMSGKPSFTSEGTLATPFAARKQATTLDPKLNSATFGLAFGLLFTF